MAAEWTAAQIERLRRYAKTMSMDEASRALGVSINAVARASRQHGVVFGGSPAAGRIAAWPAESVLMLRRLAPGMTCAEAAAQLGRTATAVRAKANALKITFKRAVQGRLSHGPEARDAVPAARAATRSELRAYERIAAGSAFAPPVAPPISFESLTNTTCRWPIGDPDDDDFGFCGKPADLAERRPYCVAHHRLAYEPSLAGLKRIRDMRAGTAKAPDGADREPDLVEALA